MQESILGVTINRTPLLFRKPDRTTTNVNKMLEILTVYPDFNNSFLGHFFL